MTQSAASSSNRKIKVRRQDKSKLWSIDNYYPDSYGIRPLFDVYEAAGFVVDHISVTLGKGRRTQWNYYRHGKPRKIKGAEARSNWLFNPEDAPLEGCSKSNHTGKVIIQRSFVQKGEPQHWVTLTRDTSDYKPVYDIIRSWKQSGERVHHISVTAYHQRQITRYVQKEIGKEFTFTGGKWHYRLAKKGKNDD